MTLPTSYPSPATSPNLGLSLQADGSDAGLWGTVANNNFGLLLEQAISGYLLQTMSSNADVTMVLTPGADPAQSARNMIIECTGLMSQNNNLILPPNKKLYIVYNNTTGGFSITAKCSGQTGVIIPAGAKVILVCNGTDIFSAFNSLSAPAATSALSLFSPGDGTQALNITDLGLGADGRSVISFVANKSTFKNYFLGIDTTGGTSKAFQIRDVNRGAIPFSIDTNGAITIYAPTSGNALTVNGVSGQTTAVILAPNVTGQSFGHRVIAGTNATDYSVLFQNATATITFFQIYGNGQAIIYDPLVGNTKNAATYETGSFSGTLTGCTTAPTGTFFWSRSGNAVTVDISTSLSATSNSNTCTITGFPAALQPARAQRVTLPDAALLDNGVVVQASLGHAGVGVISGTTLTFLKDSNINGFTATGNKGIGNGFCFTYNLT
jgi:hypothetical protein